MKHKKISFKILYPIFTIIFIFTIIVFCFICFIGVKNKQINNSVMDNQNLIDFNVGWVDKNNDTVKLNYFKSNEIFKDSLKQTIYHEIPNTVKPGDSLCFRTLSTHITIYIDDKKIIETPYKDMLLSCKSPGSVWSFYEFKKSDIGKTLKMDVELCYDDTSCYIEEMYVGNSTYYLYRYISKKIVSVILTLIILFLGIVFIVADIYMNFSKRIKTHTLLYIGLLSFVMAIWCLFSTHVVELIPGTSQSIQYASCVLLFIIPYTTLCFVKNAFNIKKDLLININLALILLLYIIATILQLTNIADYHETLILTHISLGTGICTVISSLIITHKSSGLLKINFNSKRKQLIFKYTSIFIVALLLISVIFDMILFYNGDQLHVGSFIRFAAVFVIIYLGIITSINLYTLAKQLNESEEAKKLAYKDRLTGVGNRTAFMEKLEELTDNIHRHKKIAFISFDVNNLKYVNDTYGHSAGDELIISATQIIEKSFINDNSGMYRLGGDEFVVIIDSIDADKVYKMCAIQFKVNIQNFNNFYDKKYNLSIAHGCAYYDSNTNKDIPLEDILKESDEKMYKDKAEMKRSNKVV